MQVPLVMTFKGIARIGAMKALVQELSKKVERYCDHVTSCRVAIEKDQSSQRTGRPFRVRIDMTVPPGHELVVRRESSEGEGLEPLGTLVRDAFQAVARQLKDLTAKQRFEVKHHTSFTVPGVVTRLFKDRGYGFIRGVDGREAFFHRTAVTSKNFEDIEVGSSVRFTEDQGPEGYHAQTVRLLEREHFHIPEDFVRADSIPPELIPEFANDEMVDIGERQAPEPEPAPEPVHDERERVSMMGREPR